MSITQDARRFLEILRPLASSEAFESQTGQPSGPFLKMLERAETEIGAGTSLASRSLILLEGLDGVGKSSTARRLAEMLNATLLATPLPELLPFRGFFDGQAEPTRRAFYMLSNALTSAHVRECQADVVLDRYWSSTFAYEQATLASGGAAAAATLVEWPSFLIKPTAAFMLELDEPTRLGRITARQVAFTDEEEKIAKMARFRDSLLHAYARLSDFTRIDASGTTDAICQHIVAQLGRA
jgi:dTMP kinase